MKKTFVLSAVVALLISFSTSCKKIQEDFIVKGLWRLQGAYIDTFSTNQMNVFLPLYANGNKCCEYKVDFQNDDVVFGYYSTYDTFNYVVIGNWELLKYNQIYIKLDKYVDGVFDIDKVGNKRYDMISEENHIKLFDGISPELDTTYTRLEVERL